MGYRSNVTIVTTVEGFEFLKAKLESDSLMAVYDNYEKRDNVVSFDFYSIKWSTCYSDVYALDKALREMYWDNGIPYNIAIIGEDYEDCLVESYDDDFVLPYLYIERKVAIEW